MSTPTAITVTLDGIEYPAEKVCWAQVAPCGCISGLASCYRPADGRFSEHGPYLTQAQLDQWFIETGSTRDMLAHEREQGFEWELREWESSHNAAQTDCPHTPKWGVEPIPEVEGHTWAVPSMGRRKHLVTTGSLEGYRRGSALCGQDGHWTKPDVFTRDMLECKRCLAKAKSV